MIHNATKYLNGSRRQWGLGKRRDGLEVVEAAKIWGLGSHLPWGVSRAQSLSYGADNKGV